MNGVTVLFCGERRRLGPHESLVIGRNADLNVDDNRFLHRRFLQMTCLEGLWLLRNVGSQLSATVSDLQGLVQAWLGPGSQVPLLHVHTVVYFTAGPTTYEVEILLEAPPFRAGPSAPVDERSSLGPPTVGGVLLSTKQKLVLLSLTERALRRGDRNSTSIPSSKIAAQRLGWTVVAFNRQLDNLCQKLSAVGVRGLHGDTENLAANRRARLAEYALAVRLINRTDLPLLDGLLTGVAEG